MVNGFNPLRWNCETDGCFNKLRRPAIELFADCFPGKINFGDVDGLVEINGRLCLLEWKGQGGSIKTGQRITYQRFTSHPGNAVFVVEGDAKTMAVTRYCKFKLGQQLAWESADLEIVKRAIRGWVSQALAGNAARFRDIVAALKEAVRIGLPEDDTLKSLRSSWPDLTSEEYERAHREVTA